MLCTVSHAAPAAAPAGDLIQFPSPGQRLAASAHLPAAQQQRAQVALHVCAHGGLGRRRQRRCAPVRLCRLRHPLAAVGGCVVQLVQRARQLQPAVKVGGGQGGLGEPLAQRRGARLQCRYALRQAMWDGLSGRKVRLQSKERADQCHAPGRQQPRAAAAGAPPPPPAAGAAARPRGPPSARPPIAVPSEAAAVISALACGAPKRRGAAAGSRLAPWRGCRP